MILNLIVVIKTNRYLIASLICLVLVGILASLVSPKSIVNDDFVSKVDYALFLKIVNTHSQIIDQIMIYLTIYGREVFWVLAIIFLFICGKKEGRKTAAIIALTILILIPIGILYKQIVERPRPVIPESAFLIPADSEYSFPSGHALIVSAGAAVSLVLFRKSNMELFVSILLALESGLVCFSRIYVGGHYPLDVIGGVLLGIGISFLLIWRENNLNQLFLLLNGWIYKLRTK